MAIVRTRSPLANRTPPPSPIPTGKGSRSASNEPFARFLNDSLRVPELALPLPHSPGANDRRRVPPEVDLRSLVSSEAGDSVDRILTWAKEFGVLRISGHGISVDELRSLVIGVAAWDSGDSEGECRLVLLDLFGRNANPKEEISWVLSMNKGSELLPKLSGNERENMKNVASKLEAIAEKLCQILFENARNQLSDPKIIVESKESVLSLYKYNHQSSMEQRQLTLNNEKESQLCDDFLSLHLPIEHCKILVQSEGDHFYFDAGPETLVVAIGKQLQEWSFQEFKCVYARMIPVPADIRESRDHSFSIELKYISSSSPLNLDNVSQRNCNTISIGDQIVIAIVITLIYKTFLLLTSQIVGA
ncbi:Isopenicillin N synthase-like [Parasponia andersonii]|uniref:Isopenicillin N synthase-like n=1 Tax=Parasponia andersonii TaxID=3476 RepID=A0A2P5B7D7_PARAD|nr:Isopenicillin N synthase-like [Parasponia andersonii]